MSPVGGHLRRWTRRIGAAPVIALAVQGCAVHGLAFVQDDRVEITTPSDNATVSMPLELRWEVDGYDGEFGVFFDRSPMRPGKGLESLVPEDDALCRANPACPDAAWLAARQMYVTGEPSLTVEQLPDRRSEGSGSDRHEVIIVLLDAGGTRQGEATFIREFIVDRDD
jgi:hypothetical protein